MGVSWIDTAPVYGLGRSEEVVGRAIRGLPRDRVFLATKCGRVWDRSGNPGFDLRPESIRREIEDSLRRLGTDHVDLYQIHWPDAATGTPLEESWTALARLQEEGKTRYLGVSNFEVSLLDRCEAIRHVDSLQPPYSLVRRGIEAELLPYCLRRGIGVICYSPMQSGLLSGRFDLGRLAPDDWRRQSPFFQEPRLSRHLASVEKLRPLAARLGKTVGQLAIAWTLSHPAVTAAIAGARNPAQVEENFGAMGIALRPGDQTEIEKAFEEEPSP
jgi:aryl-alcohol dehydrogenase-like predicted oxidoreductase